MIRRFTILFLVITVGAFAAEQVNAQIFDAIKKIKKEINTKKTETVRSEETSKSEPVTSNDDSQNKSPNDVLNRNKSDSSPNIIFSATPFAPGDKTSKQTRFVFGQPIYGRVFIPYSYSEMFTKSELEESRDIDIYVEAVEEGAEDDTLDHARAFRHLYPHEMNEKVFDFVFSPDAQAAVKYPIQSDLGAGFRGMFTGEKYPGRMVKMIVEIPLLDQDGKEKERARSSFYVDYTKANRKALLEAFEASEENRKKAIASAKGFLANQGTESAKSLPLPKFFSMKEGPGYTGFTKAQLANMVRKASDITDVWNIHFENLNVEEFFVVKNDLGVPLRMDSYRRFYFIWRNPDDGICRVGGGHLYKDYLGGGKYGAPQFAISPFRLEPGEKYPLDSGKNVIVDCEKARL